MLRILHVVSCMNRAGEETFIMNIFRNIDRSQIQFCFLCSCHKAADYDEEIYSLGGKIYYLPETPKYFKPYNYYKESQVLSKWLIDNREKFNIVHVHTYHSLKVWSCVEACRLASVDKVIIHSHNTQAPHKYLHYFCRLMSNIYNYKKFACGIAAAKWLFGKKAYNSGDVYIVNNGIDTEKFKYDIKIRDAYRKKLNIEDKFVIGHVGRFQEQKNHRLLIEIFEDYYKTNNDSILLLIGRGELEAEIRQKVKDKGIEKAVMFLNVRDDVPALLSAMDVFLFPSLYEGFSVCAIEVQCNGLPIVTSDIPSMREANITGNIQYCSLSSNIGLWSKCLENISQCDRIRGAAIVRNKNYDIRDVAIDVQKEYLAFFNA